jgi:hypothetical protein
MRALGAAWATRSMALLMSKTDVKTSAGTTDRKLIECSAGEWWWARLGSNQRPSACKVYALVFADCRASSCLPLNPRYMPTRTGPTADE